MRRNAVSIFAGMLVLAALAAPRFSHAQVIDPLPVGGSKMRQVVTNPGATPWRAVVFRPLVLPLMSSMVPVGSWHLGALDLNLVRNVRSVGLR